MGHNVAILLQTKTSWLAALYDLCSLPKANPKVLKDIIN